MAATLKGPVPVLKPQSSPLHILITGASRGLGLQFVQQYSQAHDRNIVFAGVRNPASAAELNAFAAQRSNVRIIPLDVDDEQSVRDSVKHVEKVTDRLDLLINNAGISGGTEAMNPTTVSSKLFTSVFNTNVVGVLLVTQVYLPLLQRSTTSSPKVANVSSALGSNVMAVAFASYGVTSSYGVSKAALNYLTTAFRLAVPTVTFFAVHPGWVATEMGNSTGVEAPTAANDSVQALRYHIAEKTIANSGEYFDINGEAIAY